MYLISELATKAGISRTTLLYYEKQGLIKGHRLDNGYRHYSESDLQRLFLIKQLQSAGLTLKECQSCLEAKLDKSILSERLTQLTEDIQKKTQARELLLGLLGERSQRELHSSLSKSAPNVHLNWLNTQGYDEKEALRLKWLSKDMNEHNAYMNDFMTIFTPLEQWAPGSKQDTLNAISLMPNQQMRRILEIGSGKGGSTLLLANNTKAHITAVDNEPVAIEQLNQKIKDSQLVDRISPVCASMTALPFEAKSFDAIWAESCVYIMGMENALQQWKPLLKDDGILVVSDLVWLTDMPDENVKQFWLSNYPNIQTIPTRLKLFQAQGYDVIDHFSLGLNAWENYWLPLKARVEALQPTMPTSQALLDVEQEIGIYETSVAKDFTYHYFIVKPSK
ncbi:MerR family transcriptional regulator [Photobacterium carnosum]|uniref:MerR family transcriptional regulator n=1 Tax=Photobacterium carnosum TaxID=2023717 RepID=UPI001E3CE43E|nr:MerR family transcriptional regulator [Photobacterium carnosum]MCD9536801.1 MerR family transcriptional regulator [Photobacterium carnosum]MCF2161633.1 MerR family transcriptional regulator [Photobacterium carnosum]